jgi:uncharacterized membrane protein YeaQ/YmgE (transglycosylase-associated protein family)
MRGIRAREPGGACGVDDRFGANIAVLDSSAENFREACYAHSLGDHHRFYCRHHRATGGAWTKQSGRFHSHDLTTLLGIAGAFVATFIGQAVGWYRPDQGAGLIGAVLGALIVLFVWHRLVSTRAIPDPGARRWL